MTRGPQPTTRRGRAAGARELRAWLSAEEYARWQAAAKAAGLKLGDYVRSLTPNEERAAGRWPAEPSPDPAVAGAVEP